MELISKANSRKISNLNFLKFIRYTLNLTAACLFAAGVILTQPNLRYGLMLGGVAVMWAANVIFSFERLKSRILMLFFSLTMFIFLIGRPIINFFRDGNWWTLYTDTGLNFAFFALFISLTAMQLGATLYEFAEKRSEKNRVSNALTQRRLLKNDNNWIMNFSLLLYVLCWACFMYVETDKLMFMRGRAYEDYYILYKNETPALIGTFAAIMPYAMCVFLATLPSKKKAFLPLASYLISAVPMLIIGQRNPIVLNAIFVFLYYFIRDVIGDDKKWLGRFEKTAIIIAVPLLIVLLALYNYTRAGRSVDFNPFSLLVDFVDKQGVSFKVLGIGYDAIPQIQNTPLTNYTFGPFIDFWYYGAFGQTFLGAPDLGNGNNEFRATHGNDFSHSMSYVAKPDYLQGHGWGSSYLLETYADFHWLGVILFSLILGLAFVFIMKMMKNGTLCRTIALMTLCGLFFVPRSYATDWLLFLSLPHFWFAVIVCTLGARLCYNTAIKRRYKTRSFITEGIQNV